MKIANVADLHLNKGVYKGVSDRDNPSIPFRYGDFMRAFEFVCDTAIAEKVDLVSINGDVYDHVEPTNLVRGFFSSQLRKLNEAKIPVMILIGNHDVCRKHHALKDIHELNLKNIKVIEKPKIINYKGQAQLLLFPYSLDIECKNVTIKDEFYKFIEEAHEKRIDGVPILFFGHFGVQGAAMNQYGEEETDTTTTPVLKDFVNRNPHDISLEDLDQIGADYVFLGDYHRFDVLATKNCVAMYTGSIEKNNFNEAKQPKGFVIYDDSLPKDEKMGQTRFIEYPNCRPMAEIKGTFEDIQRKFNELDHSQYQDGIFKLSFVGTSSELINFSTGLDGLKKEISDKTNAIHIFHRQTIKDAEMEELVSEIEQEIEEKGHIDVADVIDVVKEMIEERVENEEERQATTDLAVDIWKTAMEGE
jgi:DNA repair exonuclease SbcCD nuclease subunit